MYPWTLLGGLNPGAEAQCLLDSFWKLYRKEHPTHKVFELADRNLVNLKFTIPLAIHGDGGRTLKKQPLEVISMHPILGLDTGMDTGHVVCKCEPCTKYGGCDIADPLAQKLNHIHSTYLTHFLLCAFPSKKFDKLPGLLFSLLAAISENLGPLLLDGIRTENGDRYHFAFLGMMGDMEYHAKTGLLNRSYKNVGHRNQIPCRHLCSAGGVLHPFEDFSAQASWKGSIYHSAPWDEAPPYKHIPFEDWSSGLAARWFLLDPFHVFRLGVARNFIASAVLLLCHDGFFDEAGDSTAVDRRMARAWASFALWCFTHSAHTSGIRGFTREKFHYPTQGTFPWVGCKGSDSILLLRWLKWFSGLLLLSHPQSADLGQVHRGCVQGLEFQGIHRHGLWLTRSCRKKLEKNCKLFVFAYARLAQICLQRRLTFFAQVPKIHSMAHLYHKLEISALEDWCLNPCAWDCSMSEDFVGRIARQSRRIGNKNSASATLHAYKVKAKLTLKRFVQKRRQDV